MEPSSPEPPMVFIKASIKEEIGQRSTFIDPCRQKYLRRPQPKRAGIVIPTFSQSAADGAAQITSSFQSASLQRSCAGPLHGRMYSAVRAFSAPRPVVGLETARPRPSSLARRDFVSRPGKWLDQRE